MSGLLSSLAGQFNTPLTPEQMQQYAAWRSQLPTNLQNTEDYDLQGAFLGDAKESARGHLSDKWKKPNHMTFSNGSEYSTPAIPGGVWADATPQISDDEKKRWVFWASQQNMRAHPAQQLLDYFRENEPSSIPILPINFDLATAR